MKLYCPLSGISYKTSVGYGHGKAPHPVFYLPLKSLISQHLNAFCEGKLSEEETHLFGCALLHKLPVVWETTLSPSPELHATWRKYLEKLATICLRYGERDHDKLPHYHIDKYNPTLGNLKIYLQELNCTVAELEYGTADSGESRTPSYIMRNAENALLRMLRGSLSSAERRETFPQLMADWAADIADFPTELVTIAEDKSVILRDFWKDIVRKLFAQSDTLDILKHDVTPGDLDELIEHCECNMEIGSIHSLALMRRLREAKEILDEFRSPVSVASIQISHAEITAAFLEDEDSKVTKIDSCDAEPTKGQEVAVPTSEPIRKDYPNIAAYMRARILWKKVKVAEGE